jgi:hypothetical protein
LAADDPTTATSSPLVDERALAVKVDQPFAANAQVAPNEPVVRLESASGPYVQGDLVHLGDGRYGIVDDARADQYEDSLLVVRPVEPTTEPPDGA